MKNKKIVGYIRTYSVHESGDVQRMLIERYCEANTINCSKIYQDKGYRDRHVDEILRADKIGLPNKRFFHVFPDWECMMEAILDDEVDTILVDHKVRLYSGVEQKTVFDKICQQKQVKIIEVASYDAPVSAEGISIALYHFTDKAERRPSIVTNDVDKLYKRVSQLKDWGTIHLYLDFSLRRYAQDQYDELVRNMKNYKLLLVDSFYHLTKKTYTFWTKVDLFTASGVQMESMDEGLLSVDYSKEVLNRSLRVAIYDYARSMYELDRQALLLNVLKTFVEKNTEKWKIEKMCVDVFTDKKRTALSEMMQEREKYDLIFVESFGKISEITNQYFKLKGKLGIPIYSMREGVLHV